MDKELYNQMLNVFEELKGTTSNKEKLKILSDNASNPVLQKYLFYTYNDYKYGVTLKKLETADFGIPSYRDIFELLDDLRNKVITGNRAAIEVKSAIQYVDPLLENIIDHDMNIGVSKASIKKIWPDMFSSFQVALSDKYNDKTSSLVKFDGSWYASRKLDGVRCICVKKGNEVHFYARSGKEYLTLDVLKEDILKLKGDFVLDGECCIVDENGDEDFISIVSEIKRKNWTIANPMYQVFDCLNETEFDTHTSGTILSNRYLRPQMEEIASGKYSHLKQVEQIQLFSQEQFDELFDMSLEKGWEGLMLRKDVSYEGKRTKNMLKVKKFQDAEFEVVNCVNDDIKFIENGKQVTKNVVSSIDIIYKGNVVSVGSGLTKAQRIYFADKHDELIGKQVTVKFFQESKNADGTYSLRFPVVKCIYDGERDM